MKNILITLIAFLFLLGCKKDKASENIFFDDSVRQKYFYKKGSYWIYRDSISGRVDSFYVSDIYTHMPEPLATWYQDREEMGITIKQKPADTANKDIIEWGLGYEATSIIRANYQRISKGTSAFFYTIYSYNLFSQQIPVVGISPYSKGDTSYILRIKQLQIGSSTFNDLSEIHYGKENNNKNDCTYYFNDSVGYIKMRINFDNDTFKIHEIWELQRWHIIK